MPNSPDTNSIIAAIAEFAAQAHEDAVAAAKNSTNTIGTTAAAAVDQAHVDSRNLLDAVTPPKPLESKESTGVPLPGRFKAGPGV